MIRGKTLFKCTNYGHFFLAIDVEYMATAFSTPQPCPKCKSIRTSPAGPFGLMTQIVYKKIWKELEK